MRGVQRKSGAGFVRGDASPVVLGDQLEVRARQLAVSGLVLDAEIGHRDPVFHDAKPVPCRDFLLRSGAQPRDVAADFPLDRKSTRLNSSHTVISYAVFCLKKKTN